MQKKAILLCLLLTALCFWACTGTGDVRTGITNIAQYNLTEMDVAIFPQIGHTDWVNSVAFSPDGRQVLSGSSDNTLKLWDVATGREIRTFQGHADAVNSVAFSPDGRQIISCSNDNTLKLWDAWTGREIRTFQGHTGFVTSVAFSPDGRQIVSGSMDQSLKLWDAVTGQEVRTFPVTFTKAFSLLEYLPTVTSITFSPNGKQVIYSLDYQIRVLDVSTGKETIPPDHDYWGHSVAVSPNGRQILSATNNFYENDMFIFLWNTGTGQQTREFGHFKDWSDATTSLAFSPNGRQFLSGSRDNTLRLWNITSGRVIRTFQGHTDIINSIAFSPDGKLALSGSVDNTLKLWDVNTGKEIRTFTGYGNFAKDEGRGTGAFSGIDSRIASSAVSPDGSRLLSASSDNTLKLWDTVTGREIRTFKGHDGKVNSLAFSPDGKLVLSSSNDKTVKLWDAATGLETRTLSGHKTWVNSAAFSPDGKSILSSSNDGDLKIWDTATGREIRTISTQDVAINSVAFSPDGKLLISGSSDHDLKLWDAVNGQEVRTFSGHTGFVYSVAFSPDGRQVLSGSEDNTLKLWDVATGQETRTFTGHNSRVYSVAFSPDGKQALSGSIDGTARLWDTESGEEVKTFSGHTMSATSVAFASDGTIILSGLEDGTTRLWDVESGNEITQFISFTDGEWIAITPEGYYNASPNGDRYLNVRVGNSVYGIDQYRDTFYNPALVAMALSDRDAYLAAVQQTIQDTAAPPSIAITSPSETTSAASTSISVSVDGGSQSIQYLTVNVNGRTVARDIGVTPAGTKGLAPIARLAVLAAGDANKKQVSFNLDIPLDPGSNIIEILAFNGFSEGRALVEVSYNTTQSNLPNLYILSIGVGRYADPSVPNLRFAPNDARGIVAAFKSQEGRRYGQVRSLILADGGDREPTSDNIRDGMDFLRGARSSDIILLFLSGHGGSDDLGQFFFMPGNMAFNQNGTPQRSRIIPNSDLQDVLRFPGQKLIFIDSCYSGGFTGNQAGTVDNDTLINSLKDDAPVIFTSSSKTQQSWEWESASLGLFTHVLIQGLSGTADANRDGRITVEELGDYVKKTVPGMKDSQQPYYWSPPGYRDFVIAVTGRN